MDEIPTDDEMAEVFNSLMSLSEQYGMLYGSPRHTMYKVLRFWGKLGLRELEKVESDSRHNSQSQHPEK